MAFDQVRDASVYEELRRTFIQTAQKPTYAELSERFKVPIGTIGRIASEESWAEMRAAHLQALEGKGDATSLVLQAAARVDSRVMRAFSDVLIVSLEALSRAISELGDQLKPSTRIQALSTASFAFLNMANGSKAIGLVSFDKNLERLGKEDNGRWNPQLLHQINVTVQNLANGAKSEPPKVEPTEEA